jgi:predicted kinase
MAKSKFIICRGLPGSGKSTWAKEYVTSHPGTCIVNRDALRKTYPGKSEDFIRKLRDENITSLLQSGIDVISDDTNLIPKTFDALVQFAKDCDAEYIVQDFTDVSVEECVYRDSQRKVGEGHVGEKVVRSFVRFLPGVKRQPIIATDSTLPFAIICDLDGTLALFTNRGPFETVKCEDDAVSIPVAQTLEAMKSMYLKNGKDLRIILMSGREEQFRPHTERWLKKYNITYDALYMRTTKDFRKDCIVKRELYDANIAGKFSVLFALDDRDQMIRMYRNDLNIVVFQVADGNF